MSVTLEYKCPNCDGALEFDSTTQKMKCPFCEGSFTIEELKAMEEAASAEERTGNDWQEAEGSGWQQGETDNMSVYVCQSCGGEIVADATTGATACPYCGNPVVMKGHFTGALRPDYIIPFKLDKTAAKAALSGHFKGKRLLPKLFKDQNHIDEIKGVYVPFWLYNADADADLQYNASRVRTWSDSRYIYTETSNYRILRAGTLSFERIPADGSSKMPDVLMESIEPFDFSQAVDFETGYLAGYLADKYDVTQEDNAARVNQRVKSSTEQAFAGTVVGYNTVLPCGSSVRLLNNSVKYALYPVWILKTTWNKQNYLFAMNGETGKFVGDLPVDKGAYWRWFGLISGIAAAACAGIAFLLNFL